MKAFVHIGAAKTGSTTIQKWLVANADALRDQGIEYDRLWIRRRATRLAHIELSFCVAEHSGKLLNNRSLRRVCNVHTAEEQAAFVARYETFFDRQVGAMSGQTLILSSEYLCGGVKTPEDIAHLDAWLRARFDDVRYVIYFRRQEDLVLSRYSQRLREGTGDSFATFLDRTAKVNHYKLVHRWRAAIGATALDVRLLEPDWLFNGDLVADFAQTIGADSSALSVPLRSNESISLPAQMLLRALNREVPHETEDGKRVNPQKAILRDHILRNDPGSPRRVLTQAEIDDVRNVNAASNEALRKLCFPDRPELFPPRPPRPETVGGGGSDTIARLAAKAMADLPLTRFPKRNRSPKTDLTPKVPQKRTIPVLGRLFARPKD